MMGSTWSRFLIRNNPSRAVLFRRLEESRQVMDMSAFISTQTLSWVIEHVFIGILPRTLTSHRINILQATIHRIKYGFPICWIAKSHLISWQHDPRLIAPEITRNHIPTPKRDLCKEKHKLRWYTHTHTHTPKGSYMICGNVQQGGS